MSVELYEKYAAALAAARWDCEFVEYDWSNLPRQLDAMWLPYGMMLSEFSREIANSLNDLTNYTRRLRAWSAVVAPMTDQEKMDTVHEFIDSVAIVGLNLPAVIRSRFAFAAAHLCHQANRALDGPAWKDNLRMDHQIELKDASKHGSRWSRYDPFRLRVESIADQEYRDATHDFRNAYNHRLSPRVVIGLTQAVTRTVNPKSKAVSYAFGALPALALDHVADLLAAQCKRGRLAFEAFQDLVREHEKSIAEYSNASVPPSSRGAD
jgi:hypothetical protein